METVDREVLVVTKSGRHAVLLIVVDALPWVLVEETGFLERLAPHRGPLKTVLGYSSAALPTLFSGTMPDEHGHWTMYHLDPERSPFRAYKPLLDLARVTGREGFVRRFVERALTVSSSVKGYFKLYEVPLGLLPFFSLVETRDIFQPGGLEGVPTIFDYLAGRGVEHRVWTWRTAEAESFRQAVEAMKSGGSGVFFLYTPELDATMHEEGVFSAGAREKLKEQEGRVEELYDTARKHMDTVSLAIFSDHGMIDVTAGHDLMGYVLSSVPARAPSDYIPFYDSTIARFWGKKQGVLDLLGEVLERLDYGRIVHRRELGELGLDFGDSAYGDLVFLLEPGHVILPSFMGRDLPAAMHGYHPASPHSDAAYLSDRPPGGQPKHIRNAFKVMTDAIEAATG